MPTYSKRGPISKNHFTRGIFTSCWWFNYIACLNLGASSSYHINQRSSMITRRYLWHSYIYHPTSSTDEARQIFGQVFMRLSHYSTDTSPHNGIEHIVAGHRWGKGDTTVREDEDRHTHDWAPTRWKSSSSLIEHRWAPTRWRRHICSSWWRPAYTWLGTDKAKAIIFINSSCSHPMWWWHCYD
jgi:hypothetical protein